MKRKVVIWAIALLFVFGAVAGIWRFLYPEDTAQTFAPARFSGERLIIDAGHGGEDGGAISPNGTIESGINLAIALRLDALMGFYGVDATLLRDRDISLHDESANTIRQKKNSDLHYRVATIEAVENATLISIHQNTYPSAKYHGAQVFYTNEAITMPFAIIAQDTLRAVLDPQNMRQPTKIPSGVYIMNNVTCRAILVECGFLSNPQEELLLATGTYQTKIALALAGSYLNFQQMNREGAIPGVTQS